MISISKYFLKRKINKILKNSNRRKEYLNLKEIKSVLLLFDTKDYSDASLFIKQLKKMGKKVKSCAYKDKRDKNDYSSILYNIVTDKDVNVWKNDFMRGAVDALNSESYDLAIDLTLKENLLLQYLLVAVDSSFKVGFNKTSLPIYDMTISFSPEMEANGIITVRELSKQVIHYLATISSGNLKNKK
jgi:hypothetical protein